MTVSSLRHYRRSCVRLRPRATGLLRSLVILVLLTLSSALAQTLSVSVIEARAGRLETVRETSVVVGPGQVTEVAATTSGQVLSISRRQDMPVEAGEVVVSLDTQQLQLQLQDANLTLSSTQISLSSAQTANQGQQLQTSLAAQSAEATYRNAQQQYLEGQELFSIGAISRVDLELLEAAALSAEAAMTEAQGALATAESGNGGSLELLELQVEQAQNQAAQAQRALEEANITSPLTGKITQLFVEEGSFVSMGAPVFRVAATAQQIATFSVPLIVANQLSARGTLTIPYSGETYSAQVLSASALNPTTQLVEVTARLEPSANPIPNGTITQYAYTYGGSGGIILPSDALQLEPGRRFVFLYQNGQAVRTDVELIGEEENRVAVLGIPVGAEVIYPIPNGLRDGQSVTSAEAN